MGLSPELAQAIVRKLSLVIPYNVNVIDARGIVVASGDTSRIGTYHAAGMHSMQTGATLHVLPTDSYEGSKAGIGQIIEFGGKPIGVIGITGDPEEVTPYARLTKVLVELMVEHESLREQVHLEAMARESFIRNLISGTIRNDEPWEERARLLGIDMSTARIAILAELDGYGRRAGANIVSTPQPRDAEISNQRAKIAFQETVSSVFGKPQDMVLGLDDERVLVLTASIGVEGKCSQDRRLSALIEEMRRRVHARLGLTVTVGASTACSQGREYARAYNESLEALAVGKRLHGGDNVYRFESLGLEKVISSIAPSVGRLLEQRLFSQLNDRGYSGELLATLGAFFQNDCNISRTSESLHVHRNTLQHRLRRIRALTGCSVRRLDDLLLLRLTYLCKIYNQGL